MSDKRRLAFSIIQFCQQELQGNDLSDDAKESLEVASQCLQSAYALNLEDKHLEVSKTLENIFQGATKNEPVSVVGDVVRVVNLLFSYVRRVPRLLPTRRRRRGSRPKETTS